jgi:hypothetical protein
LHHATIKDGDCVRICIDARWGLRLSGEGIDCQPGYSTVTLLARLRG